MAKRKKLRKVYIGSIAKAESKSKSLNEQNPIFQQYIKNKKIIKPPYNINALAALYESNTWNKACIDAIAYNVAARGWKLIPDDREKIKENETIAEAEKNKLLEFFNSFNFDEVILNSVKDYKIVGFTVIEKIRNAGGELIELKHIPAHTVRIKYDLSGYIQVIGQQVAEFENDDILYIKNYSPSSITYGVPDYVSAIKTMAGDIDAKNYNNQFFENSAIPKIVITISGEIENEAEVVNDINKKVEELKNSPHRTMTMVLPTGTEIKFEKLAQERNDMNFLEFRKFNRDEIMAVHRVAPNKISIIENANRANSEGQNKTFIEEVVLPLQTLFENKINNLLRENFELKYYKFELNNPDIGNEKTKAEINKIYLENQILTVNEVRGQLGLNTIEGGDKPPQKQQGIKLMAKAMRSSDEEIQKIEKVLDGFLKSENKFIADLKKYFKNFVNDINKQIDKNKIFKQADKINIIVNEVRQAREKELKKILEENINTGLNNGIITVHSEALDIGATDEKISFILRSKLVEETLKRQVEAASIIIADTLTKDVKAELLNAEKNGLSIDEIKKRLGQKIIKDKEDIDKAQIRAERIARTELTSAGNYGRQVGAKVLGAEFKKWITTNDDRVRDAHSAMDGVIVKIDDPFVLPDGQLMLVPSDFNERCGIIYIWKGINDKEEGL